MYEITIKEVESTPLPKSSLSTRVTIEGEVVTTIFSKTLIITNLDTTTPPGDIIIGPKSLFDLINKTNMILNHKGDPPCMKSPLRKLK